MQIPQKRDLSKLFYTSLKDPQITKDQKICEKKVTAFSSKRRKNENYKHDENTLFQALKEYQEIHAGPIEKGSAYAELLFCTHISDNEIKGFENTQSERQKKTMQNLYFFEIELGKISIQNQKKFLKNKILKEYKHFLEKIFTSTKYNLSEQEEKVISNLSKTSYTKRIDLLNEKLNTEEVETLDEDHKKTKKSFNALFGLYKHPDKKIRTQAANNITKILLKHLNTAEHEINAVLTYKKEIDEMRKYPSPETSRYISDDVDETIINPLLEAVQEHYHIAHDFYKLKTKLLGVNKLAYHERSIPISTKQKKYTYQQGVKLIEKVATKLDPEFAQICNNFIQKWKIDVYPHNQKVWGAFQASFGHSDENVILLNYTDTLNDVTTLAHELGHGIHSVLSKKHQNSLWRQYGMAVAEVASTFMEDFVLEEILKECNEEEQLEILIEKINDSISTIHRQIALYQFEKELHDSFRQSWHLGVEQIWKIFQKNMKAYMWKSVSQDSGTEHYRVYRSHIRYFFYVYSYASGLLIAKTLQEKVKQNPNYIETIKTHFLMQWGAKSPKEIFASMGIDITKKEFRKTGLQTITNQLKTAEKLAKKLWKI